MSKRTLAHLLLLFTALVWGSTFTLVKSALAHTSPLLFNLLRMTLGTAALAIVNHRQLRTISAANLRSGALAGLFLGLGYQFQTLGLARTSPAKCAFITGMLVVLVPIFMLVPGLRPTGSRAPGRIAAFGACLAFSGLLFLTTPAGTAWRNLLVTVQPGDILSFAGAVAFAAHLLTLARASRQMPAGLLATLQVAFATLTMLVTLPAEHPHIVFAPVVLLALAACGLLGTAAAFTIQSFAQQVLPPTHTVLILTLEPVFAWLTSLFFLHEMLDRRALAGAALIFAGIAAAELAPASTVTEIPA